MIKVKVLRPFTDKVTGVKYKKDQIVEMTPGRFIEVIRKGDFLQIIEKKEKGSLIDGNNEKEI